MLACHAMAAYVDDGERVVLANLAEIDRVRPLILESTSAAIWRALAQHTDEGSILGHVAEAYGITVEVIADDVLGFLERLEAMGLALLRG